MGEVSVSNAEKKAVPWLLLLLFPAAMWILLRVSTSSREAPRVAEGQAASPRTSQSLDDLLGELKKTYPDRDSVEGSYRAISDRLLRFAEEAEKAPEREREKNRSRFLRSEVLFLGGASSEAEARRILDDIAKEDKEEDGAKALYLLGEHFFFQERYLPDSGSQDRAKPSAYEYWNALEEKHPQSPWAQRIARSLRYMRLLKGEPVPEFSETFHVLGESDVERSSEELHGKVLMLDFWKSSTPGQKDFELQLAKDMKSTLESYADLKGRVEVLGVNLDSRTVDFARAVREWRIPWPQHHDTLQFETPLARFFGIPREPHLVVIDPQGRLSYMGPDRAAFFRAATTELRRVRGVEDKK